MAGFTVAALIGVAGRLWRVRRVAVAQALVAVAAELVDADSEEAVGIARVHGQERLRRYRRGLTSAEVSTMDTLARSATRRVASTARIRSKEGTLDALVEQASDVIIIVDASDRIHYASPSARSLFGTPVLADVALLDLIHPRDRRLAQYLLRHARRAGSAATQGGRADLTTLGVNGHTAEVEATCRDLRSDENVGGIVVTLRDVTGQRRLERELTEQASRDSLTGLPNRLWFAERVSQSLVAQVGMTGVLLLDLDQFRAINESLGRSAGDSVLMEIGRRLQGAAGPGNVVARIDSDEFAVLVSGARSDRQVTDVAARVLAAMRRPLTVDGHLLSCLASIGVATAIEASAEEELLRHADLALAAAKAGGRDRWHRYTSSMVDAVGIRRDLRSQLMQALDTGTLIVEYQPIVDLATSRPAGFEALVRFPHPIRGTLSPVEFIDIAEESGLIVPIDRQNLRTGRIYRHRRGRGRTRDGALKQSTGMKSIHDRPAAVASRRQAGHWEGDLIIGAGQRSAMATLVERKFRTTVLVPVARNHSAKIVADALIAAFGKLPIQLRRTLTWDQGNEMFQHQRIEQATGLKIYFADPHSPWQRGSNENINGLLRQYFPKGTDLNAWTAGQLNYVAAELNDRPRLCLADQTPNQAMQRWARQQTRR